MTRAVEHIERDIAALEQSVTAIAQDLHMTYGHYLLDLGQAVKRQLVLAAYHICTQGYPDRFLNLSLNQRQELQQALRQLAHHAQAQLTNQLKPFGEFDPMAQDELEDEESAEDEMEDEDLSAEELSEKLSEELSEELSAEELLNEVGWIERQRIADEISATLLVQSDRQSENSSDSWATTAVPGQSEASSTEPTADPRWVMAWQESLEKGVTAVLHTLSYAANRLLQESDILPAKLPDPILEVAAKAGVEATSGPPNLLNLLVEADSDRKAESKMTHIMTIRLRLSEIEFADPTLGAWRSKIRGLLARLGQLGRDYQKKHREKAIATAEATWRSTWFEE